MFLPLLVALTSVAPVIPGPVPLAEAVNGTLRAAGTEPFWGLEIAGKTMKLSMPGDEGDAVTEYTVEYTTSAGDNRIIASGPLTVTLSPVACSDGMSDFTYPYSVEAVLVGKEAVTMKGCAYRPWGQDILTALPVIDACLKGAKEPPAVLYAAVRESIGLVLTPGADDGPLTACTVIDGKASSAPFASEEIPAGTQQEIFVRGPGRNPGGECYEAPEVKDADGKVVGWWLDPEGC